ncbi:MAG: hypothetical protein JNK04_24755 [Myxococcales bacterium]|nr:hypothetical protein [Myxococcales bacterium]
MRLSTLSALTAAVACWSCGDDASSLGAEGGAGGQLATGAAAEGGSPSSPCGETPGAPEFEIGTGETCFEPLPDGAVVPRVGGPQGGFHVWGAFLCAGCPAKVVVNVGLKVSGSDDWAGEPSQRVVDVLSAQVAGLIALLPGTMENPSSLIPEGSDVRLIVEIADLDGEPLHAGEKIVTLGELELWKP